MLVATLNTACGWVAGDPARVLIAAGLTLGKYQITQITGCMNTLCILAPQMVADVRGLLDDWDTAQSGIQETNVGQDGRVLVKADVLEWQVIDAGTNSPQAEVGRIQQLLYQYFGFCQLFQGGGSGGVGGGVGGGFSGGKGSYGSSTLIRS